MIFQPAKYPVMLGKFPNIIGNSGVNATTGIDTQGAFFKDNQKTTATGTPGLAPSLAFDASRANGIYSKSDTVQPSAAYNLIIIKA